MHDLLPGMHPTAIALIGKDLWTGIPIIEKVIRTVAVYGGLVVLLRLGGKRDLAQLNSFDLVVLLLLSNVVQNAVIGNDTSLSGGLLGAGILVAINGVVVRVARSSKRLDQIFEGTPTVLVEDGQLLRRAVRRLGLRPADVALAVRRQGADAVSEVKRATLEPGGALVVELRPEDANPKMGDLAELEARLDARLDAILAACAGPGATRPAT